MAMSDDETPTRVSLIPTYKIYYDIKSYSNLSRTIPQSDAVTDQRMEEERAMCEEQPPTKPIHLDIRLRLLGAIPEEVEESEPALSDILPSWSRPTLAQLMSDRLRAACHGDMRDEEQVKCLLTTLSNINNIQMQKQLDRRTVARFPKNTVQTTSNLLRSLGRQLQLCTNIEDISLWEELPSRC